MNQDDAQALRVHLRPHEFDIFFLSKETKVLHQGGQAGEGYVCWFLYSKSRLKIFWFHLHWRAISPGWGDEPALIGVQGGESRDCSLTRRGRRDQRKLAKTNNVNYIILKSILNSWWQYLESSSHLPGEKNGEVSFTSKNPDWPTRAFQVVTHLDFK